MAAARCPTCGARPMWADDASGWAKCAPCDRTFRIDVREVADGARVDEPPERSTLSSRRDPPSSPPSSWLVEPDAKGARPFWNDAARWTTALWNPDDGGLTRNTHDGDIATYRDAVGRSRADGHVIVYLVRPTPPWRQSLLQGVLVASVVALGLGASGSSIGVTVATALAWFVSQASSGVLSFSLAGWPRSAVLGVGRPGVWIERRAGVREQLGRVVRLSLCAQKMVLGTRSSIVLHSQGASREVVLAGGPTDAMTTLHRRLADALDLVVTGDDAVPREDVRRTRAVRAPVASADQPARRDAAHEVEPVEGRSEAFVRAAKSRAGSREETS